MAANNQKLQILSVLDGGDPISPLDALHRFGCMRLGARIYDLRTEGHQIETVQRHPYAIYRKVRKNV